MNSKNVEVLRRMRNEWPLATDEGPALDAAIASLSAPQPPADTPVCTGDEIRCHDGHGCECAMRGQPPAEAQPDREPADWPHQDWKGMDGAIAWHLIDRHASGWEAVGEMMDAWLAANVSPPPAEAQAVGGGEVELRHMVAKLAAHVRPTCGELWAEAERLLNRTTPPSAPVGVDSVMVPKEPSEGVLASMAIRYDHGLGVPGYYDQPVFGAENGGHKRRMESTVSTMRKLYEEVVGAGFYSREREEEYVALAQQPAAAGELAGLVGLLDEVRSHFTRDDDLPDDLLPRIDAALAGQQGGGS